MRGDGSLAWTTVVATPNARRNARNAGVTATTTGNATHLFGVDNDEAGPKIH